MTLEHAVESAARCAALRSASCSTAANVQAYAVGQAPGLGAGASVFSYATPACGAQVSASFTYYFAGAAFPDAAMTLTASSCLPFASPA
jgi:hypothetical protein